MIGKCFPSFILRKTLSLICLNKIKHVLSPYPYDKQKTCLSPSLLFSLFFLFSSALLFPSALVITNRIFKWKINEYEGDENIKYKMKIRFFLKNNI
jgi:hypothetical protein